MCTQESYPTLIFKCMWPCMFLDKEIKRVSFVQKEKRKRKFLWCSFLNRQHNKASYTTPNLELVCVILSFSKFPIFWYTYTNLCCILGLLVWSNSWSLYIIFREMERGDLVKHSMLLQLVYVVLIFVEWFKWLFLCMHLIEPFMGINSSLGEKKLSIASTHFDQIRLSSPHWHPLWMRFHVNI